MPQHDAAQHETGELAGFVLCADDYGLAPGIGRAMRELLAAGRLSAVSCMTVSPCWPDEARRLRPFADRADVGLHITLTEEAPLGPTPRLAPQGRLPSVAKLILLALGGALPRAEIRDELERQLDRFEAEFGAPPSHVDGHHHVHQLPGVRELVVDLVRRRLPPGTWLRYCDEPLGAVRRVGVAAPRAALISALGWGMRRSGLPGNRQFRGVRTFQERLPYAALFRRFLVGLGPGALVMCHPGLADADLRASDPIADRREEEFRFLASEAAGEAIAAAGLRLARLSLAKGASAFTPA